MKAEEKSAQLLDELRRLRRQVADLTARVRALEADAREVPSAEEREGGFGPAIKRGTSSRHQSAVSKALTMLGVLPAQADETKSQTLDASHHRALAKMRQLGSGTTTPAAQVDEPASDILDIAESIASDAESEIIPLPELRDEERPRVEHTHAVEPVELDAALSIDLERP